MTWTRNEAAHLLRRAAFGGSMDDVDRLVGLGREAAIDSLVYWERTPDTAWDAANPLGLARPVEDDVQLRATLVWRMYTSRRPLEAKMLWFWHSHFTTSQGSVENVALVQQLETWRSCLSGTFEAFLGEVLRDAAMLQYLDGFSSTKVAPNQNLARETLELYTVGAGNFTENDVRELSRALTGWVLVWPSTAYFDVARHDPGSKTVLGVTGNFDSTSVVPVLARDRDTAVRVCTKLYRAFVNSRLNSWDRDLLVARWTETGGDLKAVMSLLFRLPSFWSQSAWRSLVKTPMDYAFALMQRLGAPMSVSTATSAGWELGRMGQLPFNPPSVAGYTSGLPMLSASALAARAHWANRTAYSWMPESVVDRLLDGIPDPATNEQIVSAVIAHMGSIPQTSASRARIVAGLSPSYPGSTRRTAIRDAAYLVAVSPEYQLM